MDIYCQSCGQPNNYGSKKPKFCNNCGIPLDGSKASAKPPKKLKKPKAEVKPKISAIELDYEDSESSSFLPNITRIEADIQTDRVKGVKLGEIAGTSTPPEEDQIPAPPPSKDAVGDLTKEGGSIRPKGSK
jgi:hypothetical protein